MQDRLGRQIKIGQLVSVINHPEITPKVNWEIKGWVDQGLATEVILKSFITQEIIFIDVLDLEKEFD